jgi:AraC family transcriptional regulator, positive regulator of tynA and feaB
MSEPGAYGLRELSTSSAPEPEQLAYWQQVARVGSEIGMPPFRFAMPNASGRAVRSSLRWRPGSDGIHLLEGSTNLTVKQAAPPSLQGDVLVVGFMRSGCLTVEHGREEVTQLRSGELFVSDYGRQMRMTWAPHGFLFLVLPRKMVEAALGRRAHFGTRTVRKLQAQGLAPLLRMQLRMLALRASQLDGGEWAAGLAASTDLALAVLRRHFDLGNLRTDHGPPALFEVARRFIERQSRRPDLDAGGIAAELGCSRSQLYRAFAAQGQSVVRYLRDLRLDRARELLATAPPELTVGAIAYRCGYTDLSAFGKAFRRRFGVSPSDCRGGD